MKQLLWLILLLCPAILSGQLTYPVVGQVVDTIVRSVVGGIGSGGVNQVPTAINLSVTGELLIDSILTGNYTYSDADGDLEGTSTFKWYRNSVFDDSTRQYYVLSSADSGYYIRFSVVPVALTGESPGIETFADSVGPVTRVPCERYYATNTFRLGNTGIPIAEIDTSNNPGDTIRFYITGSNQPQTIDTTLSIALDTSLKVGTAGVTWDSITLNSGQIYWWSNLGQDFNISDVIYTTPTVPSAFEISSPNSDTLTYAVSIFPSPANGTVSDSCMVRCDTASIPTVTSGTQVYRGDTSNVSGDFFYDMADSLEVYVTAYAKNDGANGDGTWSVAKTDSVFIDSTGEGGGYCAQYQTVLDAMTTDPTGDTLTWGNAMSDSLVTNGYWARMEFLHIYANPENGAGEARINWINPGTYNSTERNAPDWTRLQGYRGLPGDLNTGFNANDDATKMTYDSATIAAYNRLNVTGSYYDIGAYPTVGNQMALATDYSGTMYTRMNSGGLVQGVNADGSGLWMSVVGTDSLWVFNNGVVFTRSAYTATAFGDTTIHTLSRTGNSISDNQVAIDFAMDAITLVEAAEINTIFETYMDSIGTGVQSISWWLFAILFSMFLHPKTRKRLGMRNLLTGILILLSFGLQAQTYEKSNIFIQDSLKVGTSTNSVWIDTIKAGSIIITYNGVDYTMDGLSGNLDSLDTFTVQQHDQDTAIVTAVKFDPTATIYRLEYWPGLNYGTIGTGTLILLSSDTTAFQGLKTQIPVPFDDTDYAFKLFSIGADTVSNSDTVKLDAASIVYDPTNWYWRDDGDDANSGHHIDSAKKSMTALAALDPPPGDTIFLLTDDLWRLTTTLEIDWIGEDNNNVVLTSYGGGAKPKLVGTVAGGSWNDRSGNIWTTQVGALNAFTDGRIWYETSDTVIWGVEESSIGALNNNYEYYHNNTTDTIYVYYTSDPGTAFTSVEIPQLNNIIAMQGSADSAEYVTFDGLEIAYSTSGLLRSEWPGGTNSGRNLRGVEVRNCHIHHCGYKDLGGTRAVQLFFSDMIIEDNEINDGGRSNIALTPDGSFLGDTIENITIEGNYMHDGYHNTFFVAIITKTGLIVKDVQCIGNFIENPNVVAGDTTVAGNTYNYGLFVDLYDQSAGGATIKNFHFKNNIFRYARGHGIMIASNIDSIYIWHNTFYAYTEYHLYNYNGFISGPSDADTYMEMKNNLFHVTLAAGENAFAWRAQGSCTDCDVDYNLYWTERAIPYIIHYNAVYYRQDETGNKWTDYLTASGEDSHSPVPSDPDMDITDYDEYPFTYPDWVPNAGSSALDSATYILSTDYYGNARNNPPDIGAVERQGVGWIVFILLISLFIKRNDYKNSI